MLRITYYINEKGKVEVERREKDKIDNTDEEDIVEAGLIYTSGLKYQTVTETVKKDKKTVAFTNKDFVLIINDYDQVMNIVDVRVYDDFQKTIEKHRNKANLQKFAELVVTGGMVMTITAGAAVIAAGGPDDKKEKNDIVLTTEPFYNQIDKEEPVQYEVSYNHRGEEAEYLDEAAVEEEEDIIIPVVQTNSIPAPVVTADNRINISGIKQTGICKDYTNYVKFFTRWNTGTNQRAVADMWDAMGRESNRGIATINGRYLVAMTVTFGRTGDYVDVILEDGTVIECIIADAKSPNDSNCNAYGHEKGRRGTSLVEFETVVDFEGIDISGWRNQTVRCVQLYPGMSILNPIEILEDESQTEYSDEAIEMVIDELEQELDEELASILESDEIEPVIIEDEFDITDESIEDLEEEVVYRVH